MIIVDFECDRATRLMLFTLCLQRIWLNRQLLARGRKTENAAHGSLHADSINA